MLYHERQEAGLCAVHCLNAVLQGPYFTELDLAAIGRDLDKSEQEMMLESGEQSTEYQHFMSQGSSNVALDGNFSIQVLQTALSALDLKCVPLDAPEAQEAKSDPLKQGAFICNLHDHWLTLRRIGSEWYNFNSLLPAPQHLSGFYFSAFLDSLKNEGWSIFLVVGELPKEYSLGPVDSGFGGRWLTPEDARKMIEISEAKDPARSSTATGEFQEDDADDAMMEAAIAASLQDSSSSAGAATDANIITEEEDVLDDEETTELAAAIAASLAEPPTAA